MKPLYIASVEHYSGKTALCLGIGRRFQEDGYRVGYLKPLSLQPWIVEGHVADEDAAFVKKVFGLEAEPWELSPLVVNTEFLQERLKTSDEINLIEQIKTACLKAQEGKDILILEGGGSMREGYIVGVPTPDLPPVLDSRALLIVRYRDDVRVLDDALASKSRLGEALMGIVINRVPAQAEAFVNYTVVPYLERHQIPVYGVLPEERNLAALSVGEITDALGAEVITRYYRPQSLVENLVVGAMTAETALGKFRQFSHKAVITGGDRTDIQLVALETSTTCMILTGNIHPSPLVVRQAEEFGVAILLAPRNTMEVIEIIDRIYGKTRLAHPAKLRQFQVVLNNHLDFTRLYRDIGLK